jgi:DNA modification methylase
MIEVICGDCREELPKLAADVLITDPVWPNVPEGLLVGYEDPERLLAEALEVVPETVKRIVIILRSDSDPRFLRAVPSRWPFFNAHWLQYVMPGYIGRKLGGNEIAYAFGEPIARREGQKVIPSVAPKAQPGDRRAVGHPCSRALIHMEWLVRWWSEEGETIVDPFAGSGTTGVAANWLGRDATLIEIDPGYCEIARLRCSEAAPLLQANRG